MASYKFSPVNAGFSLRYPISIELPHINLPVGKESQATAEGMLDTGGACTMGCLFYWDEVAKRVPSIVAHYDELKEHQEKPITSGGVGAGKVMISHVMGIYLSLEDRK